MEKYGTHFNLKAFYTAFLAMGPTSFDVAKKWICFFYEQYK